MCINSCLRILYDRNFSTRVWACASDSFIIIILNPHRFSIPRHVTSSELMWTIGS
uniref:Uncharacterized protein n=1 Tax=Arundo donax TaxID=35708 RepID=A0A0A9H110_ARUDO